tara:strand:+ start:10800 stop:11672 length:873 start_codon:yes stop_codon:yes gene_type:complete
MADKLEKLQAMAALAKQFGGDPESESRNKLLEQQIEAQKYQTEALRHQTRGSMFRSLMDAQRLQGETKLIPGKLAHSQAQTDLLTKQTEGVNIANETAIINRKYEKKLFELDKQGKLNDNEIAKNKSAMDKEIHDITVREKEATTLAQEQVTKEFLSEESTGARGALVKSTKQTAEQKAKFGVFLEMLKGLPGDPSRFSPEMISKIMNAMDESGIGLGKQQPQSLPPAHRASTIDAISLSMMRNRHQLDGLESKEKEKGYSGLTDEDRKARERLKQENEMLQKRMDELNQ